jgi:putative transposase
MTRLFRNKYRIDTIRAKWWDYSGSGVYFITICTKDRAYDFGEIHEHVMHHSEIGALAHQCWSDIPSHFPFVRLGEFVIMPNHVHGILIVDKTNDGRWMDADVVRRGVDPRTDVERHPVDPQDLADLHHASPHDADRHPNAPRPTSNRFGPQSRNLASIVRGYKTGVTKFARHHNPEFAWQSLYHDIIIRDDRAFRIISDYIRNNPKKWGKDRFRKRKKR